jgi:hypothetical protein
MLEDKDRTTMVLILNSSANGGNFTVELPRNVVDSKGASNADTKFLIKIDGKGVDYKEEQTMRMQEYYLLTLAKIIDL